ncbi:hypothetical protein BOW53_03930 [Solemya pervernicosa gill symbiont]|uniref:DUF4124 domain-containing protein n=2 Tax=Gammaproteobacteria incertae sedis TaxID=118884 RepID=A0A1T2L8I6_9GAMM|nr:DUF4124 domain-containing protein [Candidatus Reidiella endopervernicosa]OOZ41405.1 hypothetical protein BOW53_03930 [Solemya pervernicosa gill symbiont]QKQ27556.1 DUF4124 domain-containing protein [Candidatus Reidiella endopervernicosa]
MKSLLILILILLGGFALSLYLKPELRDQVQDQVRDIPGASIVAPAETTLYKWQDATGRWQYTDRPPSDGTAYTTMPITHDTNVVPALKQDEE